MKNTSVRQSLLSELQGHLSVDLFAGATTARRAVDEVLFVAGDAGNGCYRVEDGLVKVTMMSRAGVERILTFLGPGAIVGELAMIDGRPRSASVVAVRETMLKFLSRATFDEFAREHPEVYKNLVKVLATRLRLTDETVAAGSFLSLKAGSRERCLNSRENSVGMSDPVAL
jgi:CRP/FNR family transcriptional regulator